MHCIYRSFCRYFFVTLLLVASGSVVYGELSLDETKLLIKDIGNRRLRKAMRALLRGRKLDTALPAFQLMQMAVEERPSAFILRVLPCVEVLLKRGGYRLSVRDYHQVMQYAILNGAPLEVIEYFVVHKIFDPKHMRGGVRYDISLDMPFMRILMKDIFSRRLLPKWLSVFLRNIAQVWFMVYLLQWIIGYTLIPKEYMWVGNMGASFVPIELGINAMVVVYYSFRKIGIVPNYMMMTLLSKREKKEKEAMALFFLAHGANPNAMCFIAEHFSEAGSEENNLLYRLYMPGRYRYVSVVQLAAECDLLMLVKALIARGASLDTVAVYMEDELDVMTNPPKQVLITLTELYRRRSPQAVYKCILDFAPRKGETYQYLVERGAKHYRQGG